MHFSSISSWKNTIVRDTKIQSCLLLNFWRYIFNFLTMTKPPYWINLRPLLLIIYIYVCAILHISNWADRRSDRETDRQLKTIFRWQTGPNTGVWKAKYRLLMHLILICLARNLGDGNETIYFFFFYARVQQFDTFKI